MDFEPKVFRKIIFIRHGQYKNNPQKLTALGRKQAQLTAKTLTPLDVSKIFCSTMPRAKETAKIVNQSLKLKPVAKKFLREGLLPGTIGFYKKITQKSTPDEKLKIRKKMNKAKIAADKAFDFLFKTPKKGQSCQVVIAHGNVIRYWVCKALQIDHKKWLNMDISHASLTTIRINQKGQFVMLGFSDSGHLPHKMRTYT